MKAAKEERRARLEAGVVEDGRGESGHLARPSGRAQSRGTRHVSRIRKVPYIRLLLYYAGVVAIGTAIAYLLPIAQHAFVAPVSAPVDGGSQVLGIDLSRPPVETFAGPYDRAIITALVVLGAFALALPVAWVATFTQRLRYDPSLVQSIVILPIVAAGIVILVKNSLALAFSLAGIVAVVRFRNTLKDPKDAVYIFLVLGIGLAAGVQALDVALIVSLAFNMLVLSIWKYDIGSLYSAASGGGLLTIGDATLLPLGGMREHPRVRERAKKLSGDMETDGYLLVFAADVAAARSCVEISLTEYASNWRVGEAQNEAAGLSSFMVAVDLRSKAGPIELLGDLEERFLEQIAAAEYVPFKTDSDDDGREDDD
jgi:hypothetical protein